MTLDHIIEEMRAAYIEHSERTGNKRISSPASCAAGVRRLKQIHPGLHALAVEIAEAAEFSRRGYGNGVVYSYVRWYGEFSFLNSFLNDAWPAAKWPKNVLIYEIVCLYLSKRALIKSSADESVLDQKIHSLLCQVM